MVAAVTVAGSVLGAAGAAAAASDIHIDQTGPLFGSSAAMVPLDEWTTGFTVTNTGSNTGYLRISVADVASGSSTYEKAMTIAASVPGHTGSPVAMSTAEPCRVLTEGFVLAPGQSAAVTTTLALGDLSGSTGQNNSLSFTVRVGMSDVAPGSIAPTACSPNTVTIPGTGADGSPTSADGTVVVPAPDDTAAPGVPRDVNGKPWPTVAGIPFDPNTLELFQDWGGIVPALAFLFGSGWFLIAARRRRKRAADDDDSDFEESYEV
jgi:hypothetical protein